MKNQKTIAIIKVAILTVLLMSCSKKNDKITDQVTTGSNHNAILNDLNKIASLGYNPFTVRKKGTGYLVENDIFLSRSYLDSQTLPKSGSPKTEQYQSIFSVSIPGPTRVLNVYIDDPTNNPALKTAVIAALQDYNDVRLKLSFKLSTDPSVSDITINSSDLSAGKTPCELAGGTILGQDGAFPNVLGTPGSIITITNNPNAIASKTPTQLKVIIIHELGHAIGLRHTDYYNRLLSFIPGAINDNMTTDQLTTILQQNIQPDSQGCSTKDEVNSEIANLIESRNEDQGKTYLKTMLDYFRYGVNDELASHIYGTPTKADPESIMLSHSVGQTGLSTYDKIALLSLYGSDAQKAFLKKTLYEDGTVNQPQVLLASLSAL
ncbi:hypothetical protein TH53_00450 [Pedobacter lusitanus]|uniref:Peptidase metallopeptidase domain-containing protein n=1 Tax=Pedobacter lusitanus TaxID=1503925 RepID=A0A0D0FAY5_9SPHI|nr:M57 family metalloprotease [Pedobacter lusitanus]KIO78993.1 hypothetical protein TH53_00450 [Pedobacter lusitanus]